jgi:hypothetical protein
VPQERVACVFRVEVSKVGGVCWVIVQDSGKGSRLASFFRSISAVSFLPPNAEQGEAGVIVWHIVVYSNF